MLRSHCGYIPLWRLLHYWSPEYLTTTSLLEPKHYWFSRPLLDKGDKFYWTRSHGGTSKFPASKVNDSFNILLLSLYTPPHIHPTFLLLVPPLIIFVAVWPLSSHCAVRTMCVCFRSVLYEAFLLQHSAPLKVSTGNSGTVFTSFISFNFFFHLTVKLISSYSGFWNLFTPWRKENNVFLLTWGWAAPWFSSS